MMGKAAAMLGPPLVGVVALLTHNTRHAISRSSSCSIGAVFLVRVKVDGEAARRPRPSTADVQTPDALRELLHGTHRGVGGGILVAGTEAKLGVQRAATTLPHRVG